MENLLECSICLTFYDENQHTPRALPCQHVLCSQCLFELKQSSRTVHSILCPICRKSFTSNLNEIPKSIVIMQLIELNKDKLRNNGNRAQQTIEAPFQPQYSSHIQSQHTPDIPYQPKIQPKKITPSAPVTTSTWNIESYLKSIFDEIDINRDGSISSNELQNILRNVQSNASFDPKTVYLLIKKYDKNGDNEINFNEFFDLYNNLNDELETFLLTDSDGSGSIDQDEFEKMLRSKGFNFGSSFFDSFFRELYRFSHRNTINFDLYIRVSSRLDYLLKHYNSNSYYNKNFSEEDYFLKTFFHDFW